MSKAEKFIEEHTKDSFNYNSYAQDPIPWLTQIKQEKLWRLRGKKSMSG